MRRVFVWPHRMRLNLVQNVVFNFWKKKFEIWAWTLSARLNNIIINELICSINSSSPKKRTRLCEMQSQFYRSASQPASQPPYSIKLRILIFRCVRCGPKNWYTYIFFSFAGSYTKLHSTNCEHDSVLWNGMMKQLIFAQIHMFRTYVVRRTDCAWNSIKIEKETKEELNEMQLVLHCRWSTHSQLTHTRAHIRNARDSPNTYFIRGALTPTPPLLAFFVHFIWRSFFIFCFSIGIQASTNRHNAY